MALLVHRPHFTLSPSSSSSLLFSNDNNLRPISGHRFSFSGKPRRARIATSGFTCFTAKLAQEIKRETVVVKEKSVSVILLAGGKGTRMGISDGKPCGVESVCWFGRTSKGTQISSLKSGVDIVIGTPGHLKDLIEMGLCCFQEVSFVVLDEADRMLDMRFELEVRYILGQTW